MQRYALRGVREWTQPRNDDLRRAAKRLIGGGIVENEAGVWRAIREDGDPRFLPMVELPSLRKAGYEWCFFLPLRHDGRLVSLVLLLLAEQSDTSAGKRASLAFRFERESLNGSRHQYWHVQLTRKIRVPGGVGIDVKRLPAWLPDSYPAFPVPGESWFDMFLAMLTAVHGYPSGVEDVIKSLWQKASQADKARVCLSRLKVMGVAAASVGPP